MKSIAFDRHPITDDLICNEAFVFLLFQRLMGPYPNVYSASNPSDSIEYPKTSDPYSFGERGNLMLDYSVNENIFPEYKDYKDRNHTESPYAHRFFTHPNSDALSQYYVSSVGVRLFENKKFETVLETPPGQPSNPNTSTGYQSASATEPLLSSFLPSNKVFNNPKASISTGNLGIRHHNHSHIRDRDTATVVVDYCFSGRSLWQWLLDCTDIVYQREAMYLANLIFSSGMIEPIFSVESRCTPEDTQIRIAKDAFYKLSDTGRTICVWPQYRAQTKQQNKLPHGVKLGQPPSSGHLYKDSADSSVLFSTDHVTVDESADDHFDDNSNAADTEKQSKRTVFANVLSASIRAVVRSSSSSISAPNSTISAPIQSSLATTSSSIVSNSISITPIQPSTVQTSTEEELPFDAPKSLATDEFTPLAINFPGSPATPPLNWLVNPISGVASKPAEGHIQPNEVSAPITPITPEADTVHHEQIQSEKNLQIDEIKYDDYDDEDILLIETESISDSIQDEEDLRLEYRQSLCFKKVDTKPELNRIQPTISEHPTLDRVPETAFLFPASLKKEEEERVRSQSPSTESRVKNSVGVNVTNLDDTTTSNNSSSSSISTSSTLSVSNQINKSVKTGRSSPFPDDSFQTQNLPVPQLEGRVTRSVRQLSQSSAFHASQPHLSTIPSLQPSSSHHHIPQHFEQSKPQLTLETIVQDAALRFLFREFLQSQHAEESLQFYTDLARFLADFEQLEQLIASHAAFQFPRRTLSPLNPLSEKRSRSASPSKSNITNSGASIASSVSQPSELPPETHQLYQVCLNSIYIMYHRYLAIQAPCELNIDSTLRSRLVKTMNAHMNLLKSPSTASNTTSNMTLSGNTPTTSFLSPQPVSLPPPSTSTSTSTSTIPPNPSTTPFSSFSAAASSFSPSQSSLENNMQVLREMATHLTAAKHHVFRTMEIDSMPKFLDSEIVQKQMSTLSPIYGARHA